MGREENTGKRSPAAWQRFLGMALILGIPLILLASHPGVSLFGLGADSPHKAQARVMGVNATVLVGASPNLTVTPEAAAEQALQQLYRAERLLGTGHADSDTARLNQTTPGSMVKVDPMTWDVVMEGLRFWHLSDGAFDLTDAPLLRLYDQRTGIMPALPAPRELAEARALVRASRIQYEREGMRLGLSQKGMALNLAAIARAYAVDRAMHTLLELGATDALVRMGEEVRIQGEIDIEEESASQQVGTRSTESPPPASDQAEETLTRFPPLQTPWSLISSERLTNCAAAVAGERPPFLTIGGKRYSHLIDPRTGLPAASGVVRALVTHPTRCTHARALASIFAVLSREEAQQFIEEFEEDLALRRSWVILYRLLPSGTVEKEVLLSPRTGAGHGPPAELPTGPTPSLKTEGIARQ